MIDKLLDLPDRLGRWLGALPLAALALIGVLIVAGVGVGGYYAYETYDYVQHDNDFCLSCHLMVDPYQRFAESAHRGLGCKACHQPTLVTRSRMALTQIIENPEELGVHAEVPNRVCADCHIEGDPNKWELVANTAGHKVHFESDDPSLQGLQCVQCHASSVHEFAATDQTCGQSGCHEDIKVRLGAMANLTIHCAACHNFTTPVTQGGDQASALAALAPDENECLACHAMRQMVDLPDPDPHKGACAACHNAHTQTEPHDAVESCAKAGCHTDVADLSPFHRGMGPGVLEDCTNCHEAHDFHVETTNCLGCHQDIYQDEDATPVALGADDDGVVPPPTSAGPVRPGRAPGPSASSEASVGDPSVPPVVVGWWSHRPGAEEAPQHTPPQQAQQAVRFRHSQHRGVNCTNCHDSENVHGAITVTSIADCRGCHHTEPVDRDCARCHEEHRRADNTCVACHRQPPASAHPPDVAHTTCSGSGCHQNPPFERIPTTRSACLVCHQEQVDHRVGQSCAECHALDESGGGGVQ